MGTIRPKIQQVVAENVKRLKNESKSLGTVKQIAKRARIGEGSVHRILHGQVACAIDTLDAVAVAYGLQAWQLLIPDIDPQNPPTLRTIGPREDEFMRRLAALRAEYPDITEEPPKGGLK